MADKPRPTLADYVTIALSPALIVAMIASLVFFLVAILYRGEFTSRLEHILFWFIFGMVLVARISMETGIAERAPLYGAVLAFVVWLGMGRFVTYPEGLEASSWLINAGLVALVWWLAYRLTYSCTWIDENAEASGAGVLHAAGLDESNEPRGASPEATRAPGVWVIYFALAALPIYGLGQALIDTADLERRRWTFWLMALYVASALGLLATTSFLGLRLYLRQRRLQMPPALTAAWLTLGGGLLVAFVVVAALSPRPQAEFSILNLTPAASKPRDPSKFAVTRGEPGEGEGRARAQQLDPKGAPIDSKSTDHEGAGGKGQAKGAGEGEKGEGKGAPKDAGKQSEDSKGSATKQESQEETRASSSEAKSQPAPGDNPGRRSWFSDQPWLARVATALKWIVFAALALVTIVVILRGGLRHLANFYAWARRLLEAFRRFWDGLYGRPQPAPTLEEAAAASAKSRPFAAFSNPLHDGRAEGMLPGDLVRYSFEALEAWAEEEGRARGVEETPIEFTTRLAAEAPGLDDDARRLGVLTARVFYARSPLPADARDAVAAFWASLEAAPRGGRAHRGVLGGTL